MRVELEQHKGQLKQQCNFRVRDLLDRVHGTSGQVSSELSPKSQMRGSQQTPQILAFKIASPLGTAEIAQWLRAFVALSEDLSLSTSTHR